MEQYICTTPQDVFDSFIDRLWSQLMPSPTELPAEGVGEVATSLLPLAFAVSRSQRFATFRWWLPAHEDEGLVAGYCEAFCVPTQLAGKPGSLGSRVGLLRRRTGRQGPGSSSPAWDSLQSWLRLVGLEPAPASKPLPGFVELSALLASRGLVATSSAQVAAELDEAERDLAYYKQLADEQREELRQATARLRTTEDSLFARRPPEPAPDGRAEPSAVDNLDELPQWCEVNKDRIVVLPRALGGAKKSLYEKPELVYKALEYLAGPFREYRSGRLSLKESDQALVETGLRIAGSVGVSIAGEQGDEYFVPWNGRRRFLDLHLLRGGGRDERYCLRVYFFWDADEEKCVVGWLPSHLSNSLS